jgi:hypothetical protein
LFIAVQFVKKRINIMFKKTILSLLALTIITSVSFANPGAEPTFEPEEDTWFQSPLRCTMPDGSKVDFPILFKRYLKDKTVSFNTIKNCCEARGGAHHCREFYTKEEVNSTFLAAHYGGKEYVEYMAHNKDRLDFIYDTYELSSTMKIAQNNFRNTDKAIQMLDFAIFKADGNPLTKNKKGKDLKAIAEDAGQTKIAAWVRDVALKAPRFASLSSIEDAQKAFTGRIVKFALKDALEEERKTGKLAAAIKGSDIFKIFERWMSTNGNKAFSRT